MRFALYLSLCVSLCIVAASPQDEDWELYKERFDKKYNSEEEHEERKGIFLRNMDNILSHNARYGAGLTKILKGVNQFTDMTLEEFKSFTSCLSKDRNVRSSDFEFFNSTGIKVPKHVDWREKGAVTGVKDQGPCGSCWAFSVVGSLEGTNFLKTGNLVDLSVQNLVDCYRSEDSQGCSGGYMDKALRFIEEEGGIDSDKSYPYREGDSFYHPTRSCKYNKSNSAATVKKVVKVEPTVEAVMEAVATMGPLSIGVFATGDWFDYKSGVLNAYTCKFKAESDHGAVLVGYGTTDEGVDYWLVKNSWGTTWGEGGYIRVQRGLGYDCAIWAEAVYATE